jgi:hypothetical protein
MAETLRLTPQHHAVLRRLFDHGPYGSRLELATGVVCAGAYRFADAARAIEELKAADCVVERWRGSRFETRLTGKGAKALTEGADSVSAPAFQADRAKLTRLAARDARYPR